MFYSMTACQCVLIHYIFKYDYTGESDDDREELCKAANAACNASSMHLEPF